jgi:hypothetical protein
MRDLGSDAAVEIAKAIACVIHSDRHALNLCHYFDGVRLNSRNRRFRRRRYQHRRQLRFQGVDVAMETRHSRVERIYFLLQRAGLRLHRSFTGLCRSSSHESISLSIERLHRCSSVSCRCRPAVSRHRAVKRFRSPVAVWVSLRRGGSGADRRSAKARADCACPRIRRYGLPLVAPSLLAFDYATTGAGVNREMRSCSASA